MSEDRRALARWAVFVGLIVVSFALYWAGTTGGPEAQMALLVLLVGLAATATLIR